MSTVHPAGWVMAGVIVAIVVVIVVALIYGQIMGLHEPMQPIYPIK